jgi:AP-1 complex subunit gamma-1
VATNTQLTGNKLSGMSVLYECVQTVMSIDADPGLRVMAVNTLGKFLAHTDNNMRYVALNSLAKIAGSELQALQRHRTTVVECLRDQDIRCAGRRLMCCYFFVIVVVLVADCVRVCVRAAASASARWI